jgi:aminobenzoyl-glutamate utilization protein B
MPDFAEAYYYARHPDIRALDGIWARIIKCAEGAALASETRIEMEVVNSVYNLLPNNALTALLDRNLKQVGGVRYSPEEQAFAEKLRSTLSPGDIPPLGSQEQVQAPSDGHGSGSTDVGDVSWIVPTGQFTAATYVPGVPGHSWQSTACAGSSIGIKGMLVAAKTLALTGLDLLTEPEEVKAARASFDKRRAGQTYESRVPANQKPPLSCRDP